MGATLTSERARVVKELSGFKLLKELGQGGMGKVFLARQTSLDRVVALKVLVPELAADAEFVGRFHREAKSAARFQHPNIVAVFDQGQDPSSGVHYIAFEFVDGGSLEELLERRVRLPEAEALTIVRAVATALEYAETAGIVHRDVKPENILLTKQGLPKLADLGLAKQTGVASSVTQSGVVLGTPLYMAPEQALGEPDLDGRADLYALGLCLWRALTGLMPFDEERANTPLQLLAKHINQDLPDVRARAPEVSEGTAKLVAWLAARDRAQRYASASDLVADIDLILRGEAPIGPHDRDTVLLTAKDRRRSPSGRLVEQPPPPRLPRPTAPILAGVLVGALGIGVGLALAVTGRKGRGRPAATATQTSEVALPTTEVSAPVVRRTTEPVVAPPAASTERETPPPTTTPPTTTPPTTTSEAVGVPSTTEPAVVTRPTPGRDERAASTIEAGLRLLREALVTDAQRARPVWRGLRHDLEALGLLESTDADTAAAVARLVGGVEGLLALLEADVAGRPARARALDALFAEVRASPLASPAGRAVDDALTAWAVLLADVAELEAILCEVDPAAREEHAAKVQTQELKLPARGLIMVSRMLESERERGGRGPRDERDELRLATARRGAVGTLLDASLDDVARALELQRGSQGGWATTLARLSLTSGAPPSPFLAARVADIATSSTGQPLGPARGLLVAIEGGFGEGSLSVSLGGTELVLGAEKIRSGGRAFDAPPWGDDPVVVVELHKDPLVLALDPRTGEVRGSREVKLPGQLGAPAPLSYGVDGLGLLRVALLSPGDGPQRRRRD
jgi:serine/threonine-protein kinase